MKAVALIQKEQAKALISKEKSKTREVLSENKKAKLILAKIRKQTKA